MKIGDKIKFGKLYCEETGRPEFLGQTIMLTPQLFEEENGLYSYFVESPGVYNKEMQESESIYHLFDDDLSDLYDCEIIPGTEEDVEKIKQEQIEMENKINKEYEKMGEYFSNLKENTGS